MIVLGGIFAAFLLTALRAWVVWLLADNALQGFGLDVAPGFWASVALVVVFDALVSLAPSNLKD